MEVVRHNRYVFHVLVGVLLTIVYPMQELFSGNQNIYFLWSMDKLIPGAFSADPLLLSPDPYPLFSWLVAIFPAEQLGVWITLLYVLLSAVYSFSMFGIADHVSPLYNSSTRLFSFSALFLLLHSAPIWGTYSQLIFDVDLRWMWDSGIAEQGVLRGYLQPSVFGVFLLLSIHLASQRRFALAILCIAPAAMMHANYLFLGAIMTCCLLIVANFGKWNMLAAGVLLLSVLPYSYYISDHFLHLDAGVRNAIDEAVMAGYDANIHINPENWLNPKFYGQLLLLAIGLVTLRNSRIRNLMLILTLVGILLTSVAYLVHSTTLISLNPWRISIVLIPVASATLLTTLVSSGIWSIIRSHMLSAILLVGLALMVYRLFGNGSFEFISMWKTAQIAAFILIMASAGFVFRNGFMKRSLVLSVLLVLLAVGSVDMYVNGITKANKDEHRVGSVLLSRHEPNTIYIIPPQWTAFRLNARKAVHVDDHLVYGPALPALTERRELTVSAYGSNDFSELLRSIPTGITVKLIAPSDRRPANAMAREDITDRYASFLLRQ